jgi:Transglycosylase-like domain
LRKVLAGFLCAGVATVPAVAFAATNDENDINVAVVPQAASSLTLKHDAKAKIDTALTRAKRDERKAAKRKRERRLAKQRAAAPAPAAASSGSATPGNLQAIAACESGGDPSAVGGGGAYRGKYQFDYQTWASVGGTGDPAAAPESEQDQRAAALYAQSGTTPWPVCGQ